MMVREVQGGRGVGGEGRRGCESKRGLMLCKKEGEWA